MNTEQFYEKINNFKDKFQNRDLEEYLLSLYKLVVNQRDREITLEFIIKVLGDAFTSELCEFNEEWLRCNTPPDENRLSKKFTNPNLTQKIDKSNTSDLEPFDFTIAVIKFQVAELHKMRDKQLKDEERYFGVTSETGHRWYNFDPFGNLSCGVACMQANKFEMDLNWSIIGELLENGRIYE